MPSSRNAAVEDGRQRVTQPAKAPGAGLEPAPGWLHRRSALGSRSIESPVTTLIPAIVALSLLSLAALGAFGGYLGGAPLGRASLRVTLGGALAMAVTAMIGRILGVSVG